MVAKRIPRKIFKFVNKGVETRELRMSFRPEIVHIEQMSLHGRYRAFNWPNFHVEQGTVKITLPPGQYRITIFGSHPEDIERWENEGGPE